MGSGADPDQPVDMLGRSSLHLAVSGSAGLVALLLKHGASPFVRDNGRCASGRYEFGVVAGVPATVCADGTISIGDELFEFGWIH